MPCSNQLSYLSTLDSAGADAFGEGPRFSRRGPALSSKPRKNNHLDLHTRERLPHACQSGSGAITRAGTHLSIRVLPVKSQRNQADTRQRGASDPAPGSVPSMKRFLLAHLPLRTKLVAASALTASIALFIAALTQGVSSYFYSHSEAYEHLASVTRVIAGRSAAAIQSHDFGEAEALVSALRVEPHVEEALLVDKERRVLMHYAGSKTMLMSNPNGRAFGAAALAAAGHREQRAPASLRRPVGAAPGLPDHGPGPGHRPPVRARQSHRAAAEAHRAAGLPARQFGGGIGDCLSTGAPGAAPDRRPSVTPGRHHAGRRTRRLLRVARRSPRTTRSAR